jgi:hypothetical protein
MTLDEAREEVIPRIDYAALMRRTLPLHDADKNHLLGRPVYKPSPWAGGILKIRWQLFCGWPMHLNLSVPAFREHNDFSKMKNRSWAEWSDERTSVKPDEIRSQYRFYGVDQELSAPGT